MPYDWGGFEERYWFLVQKDHLDLAGELTGKDFELQEGNSLGDFTRNSGNKSSPELKQEQLQVGEATLWG